MIVAAPSRMFNSPRGFRFLSLSVRIEDALDYQSQVFGIDFLHFDVAVQENRRRLLQLDALSPLFAVLEPLCRPAASHPILEDLGIEPSPSAVIPRRTSWMDWRPVFSMSSRVRICTGAAVSASARLMFEPVTSIFSTFWACCATALPAAPAPRAHATMASTSLVLRFIFCSV